MSGNVTSLQDALSQVRDFRHPQGRRYQLPAVLVLSCLAMMNGAHSEQAIADWSGTEGRRWMRLLGIRRQRGPSPATIHRIFRGIDRRQLEEALSQWSRQIIDSQSSQAFQSAQSGKTVTTPSESDSLSTMSFWADLLKAQLETGSAKEHISEAGLKMWGLELDPAASNSGEPCSLFF